MKYVCTCGKYPRDRVLKKPDTPIISGLRIYHNYIRPHMALDGRTPSEVAGIKVEGEIQIAHNYPERLSILETQYKNF